MPASAFNSVSRQAGHERAWQFHTGRMRARTSLHVKAANKLNIFNGRFNPSMRFLGRRGSGHVEAAAAAFRFVIRFV